ncbi:MAG: DUF4258 domain-containing protein [Candidatus Pacearchaeota archaeon]|jgi:hypothetical protein
MEIILSYHAKKRVLERNIRFNDIKETIEIPDYTISKDSKKEAYKKINNKILKVIYITEDKYIKVITLMWK